MVAEIGNGMADLLATHFNSGLVAAKLGGGERPVCGNPGTGALWRDLGFVAQRYVVKVLWYSRITSLLLLLFLFLLFFLQQNTGSETWLGFLVAFGLEFMRFAFVVLDVVLYLNCCSSERLLHRRLKVNLANNECIFMCILPE